MKITRMEVFPIGMAYARPYEQATGVTRMARRVIVKLYTDEGIVGLGEASTLLPNRTGESAQVITVVLVNHLGPLLIGENPFGRVQPARRDSCSFTPRTTSPPLDPASPYGGVTARVTAKL